MRVGAEPELTEECRTDARERFVRCARFLFEAGRSSPRLRLWHLTKFRVKLLTCLAQRAGGVSNHLQSRWLEEPLKGAVETNHMIRAAWYY